MVAYISQHKYQEFTFSRLINSYNGIVELADSVASCKNCILLNYADCLNAHNNFGFNLRNFQPNFYKKNYELIQ